MILSKETLEIINKINMDKIDIKGVKDIISQLSVELDLQDNAKTLLFSGNVNGIYY